MGSGKGYTCAWMVCLKDLHPDSHTVILARVVSGQNEKGLKSVSETPYLQGLFNIEKEMAKNSSAE